MIVPLSNDEAALVRYALNELANKRAEQAIDGRARNSEWADANEREAKRLREIADRLKITDS